MSKEVAVAYFRILSNNLPRRLRKPMTNPRQKSQPRSQESNPILPEQESALNLGLLQREFRCIVYDNYNYLNDN